jgi:glycosyltransferase involved in cell wall biosynthesis
VNVSVVIPLYNKAPHIEQAVSSVLAQTFQDFELIVVDDGSIDGGGDIVRRFTDPRIRLIVQNNSGVSAARNRGIQEARCDLVAFLDADDEWLPCFLETVMGLRARHPQAGMYATAYRYSQGGESWRPAFSGCGALVQGGLLEDYFRAALGPAPVWSSAVMIPKPVLAEVQHFPVGVRRGEDLQTWAAIALRYRVAWSPVDGAIYNLDASNRACLTQALAPDAAAAVRIEEFLASGNKPISDPVWICEYLAKLRLEEAREQLSLGHTVQARKLLRKARGSVLQRRRHMCLAAMCLIPRGLFPTVENIAQRLLPGVRR